MAHLGDFPTAHELQSFNPQVLSKKCGLGYRGERLVKFAQGVVTASQDSANPEGPDRLTPVPAEVTGGCDQSETEGPGEVSPIEEEENPSYDLAKLEGPGRLGSPPELLKAILAMPGLGPFSAANVMQCLGEYDVVAADSETARHLREVMLSSALKTLLDLTDFIECDCL